MKRYCSLVLALILLVSGTALAQTLGNAEVWEKDGRQVVEPDKIWTVTLNADFDPASLQAGEKGVRVFKLGEKTPWEIRLEKVSSPANSFRIIPVKPYEPGEYNLLIGNTLVGVDGKKMKTFYSKRFTVREKGKAIVNYVRSKNPRALVEGSTAMVDELHQPISPGALVYDLDTNSFIGTVKVQVDKDGNYSATLDPAMPTAAVEVENEERELFVGYDHQFYIGRNYLWRGELADLEARNEKDLTIGTLMKNETDSVALGICTDITYFEQQRGPAPEVYVYVEIQPLNDDPKPAPPPPPPNMPNPAPLNPPPRPTPIPPAEVVPIDENPIIIPRPKIQTSPFSQVIDGQRHHTVFIKDGSVYWMGGISPNPNATKPILISGISDIKMVAATNQGFVALDSSGKVWEYEQGSLKKDPVFEGAVMDQIAAGERFVVALDNTGQVHVIGDNEWGQHGNGTAGGNNFGKPSIAKMPDGENVIQIGTGPHCVIALTQTGKVYMWGYNQGGAIVSSEPAKITLPYQIAEVQNAKQVLSLGARHFALLEDSTVATWGSDSTMLGLTAGYQEVTTAQHGRIVKIAARNGHLLMLQDTGLIYGFGVNLYGQLGVGDTRVSNGLTDGPFLVKTGAVRMADIGIGYDSSYAIDEDGNFWVWGGNTEGQLGIGTRGSNSHVYLPIQLD